MTYYSKYMFSNARSIQIQFTSTVNVLLIYVVLLDYSVKNIIALVI